MCPWISSGLHITEKNKYKVVNFLLMKHSVYKLILYSEIIFFLLCLKINIFCFKKKNDGDMRQMGLSKALGKVESW